MFITTVNKCTFSICYKIPLKCCENDNLWGYVDYEDSNIDTIKGVYEQYIWNKLLLYMPTDQFKNKTFYNQYSCDDDDDDDDQDTREFFSQSPYSYKEETEDSNKAFTIFYNDSLAAMQKHKRCVDIAYHIMQKENHSFEIFQKSVLYEHLFFYVSEHDRGILRPFIMAMYPYFAFDYVMIDHVIKMYTKKHYVSIIPRRHGKTMTIYVILASFLLAYKSLTVLAIAQAKKIVDQIRSNVISFLTYWNTAIEPNSISYRLTKNTDNLYISYKGTEMSSQSLLQCASAHSDQSARGPDPQIAIVDETLCINPSRFNSIIALGQKKMCKLGFLSSPTPKSKDRIILFITKIARALSSGTNFYFINYFCGSSSHAKYSSSQSGCVDLIFYKPRHITFSEDNKTLTDIMTTNVECYEGELGIIKDYEIEDAIREERAKRGLATYDFKSFSQCFYEFFKTDKFISFDRDIVDLFIYVDPAFCPTARSGIGICCCGRSKRTQQLVIFYLDHRFLEINELTKIEEITFNVIVDCIQMVLSSMEKSAKRNSMMNFFVAIEHNNFIYSVGNIYNRIKLANPMNYNVYLYYTHRTESYISASKSDSKNVISYQNSLIPGYGMTICKRNIVNRVISLCNNLQVQISVFMPCDKKICGMDPIYYFLNQCKGFKWIPAKKSWSGKTSRQESDDLVIASIMSIYFASNYGNLDKYKKNTNFKTPPTPWIPVRAAYVIVK